MLIYDPSIPILLRVFNHEWILNFSNELSASIEITMWLLFFSYVDLICCNTSTHLHMLIHPYDTRMNPTSYDPFQCDIGFNLLIFYSFSIYINQIGNSDRFYLLGHQNHCGQ